MFHSLQQFFRRATGSSSRRRQSNGTRNLQQTAVQMLESRELLIGAFSTLTNANPFGKSHNMLLLTDGSVMVQTESLAAPAQGVTKTWAKLTPDSSGNYQNGTWSALAPMSLERQYYNSFVLPNGRVLIIGGQNTGSPAAKTDTNRGEIYNPTTNTWTPIAPYPAATLGAGIATLLPTGKVLVAGTAGVETYLYDPNTNTWSQTGSRLNSDKHDQATWIMLRDGSVLAYTPSSPDNAVGRAQRYIPSTGRWVTTGAVPVPLTNDALDRDVGTGTLLPNGRALLIGANGKIVLYNPVTDSWTVSGATVPDGISFQDGPASMLPDGKFLFVGGTASHAPPSRLFEYNYATDQVADVTSAGSFPGMNSTPAFVGRMLNLPNGQILFTMADQVHIASPSGAQLSALAPTVVRYDLKTVSPVTFQLIGTQFNGHSEGSSYGSGAQMATNFPIIRLRDPATGLVKYITAKNWTPGLARSSTEEMTVEFDLPSAFSMDGIYQLSVITNGITSAEVTFKPNDMVKDVYLNAAAANPKYLTEVNGVVYFVANEGTYGDELWKSDGTKAGTVLVKDIRFGPETSNPRNLMNVNGVLYFTADNGKNGVELWKSDGTSAGTVMVSDIYTGKAASNPSNIINVNGTLYFSAVTAKGAELWKSNGTAAGTVMVKDIRTGVLGSSPQWLTAINNTLYFTANNGTQGVELWKSDGTASGTVLVRDIYTGVATSNPQNLMATNGTLYFAANSGISGLELWKSDGTAAGTVLVKDIDTRPNIGSNPKNMKAYNGFVYFQASTLATGAELWRTDGTTAGTVLFKEMNPGKVGSFPANFHEFNGALYFTYQDQIQGTELAKSNGTIAGTGTFKNISTSLLTSSFPTEFVNIGSHMYFKAGDLATGLELYRTDGTAAGTTLIKDINFRTGDANPSWLIRNGSRLFFAATNGFLGEELFMIDTALLP